MQCLLYSSEASVERSLLAGPSSSSPSDRSRFARGLVISARASEASIGAGTSGVIAFSAASFANSCPSVVSPAASTVGALVAFSLPVSTTTPSSLPSSISSDSSCLSAARGRSRAEEWATLTVRKARQATDPLIRSRPSSDNRKPSSPASIRSSFSRYLRTASRLCASAHLEQQLPTHSFL